MIAMTCPSAQHRTRASAKTARPRGAIAFLMLAFLSMSCGTVETETLVPDGTALIHGSVVDERSRAPIAGARVSVLFGEAGVARLTAEDGSFRIPGIDFGSSRCAVGDLRVTADGHGVWELKGFLFGRGSFNFNEIELGTEDRVEERDPLPADFSCND